MRLSFFFSPFGSFALALVLRMSSWRFVCLGKFFSLVSSPLPFSSLVLFTYGTQHYSLAGVCLLCLVSSASLFSVRVSLFFSFSIRRSRFRCFISCFCMILSPCFTLLAASLSFSFFICAGLSSSLPVLSVSLSFLPSVVSCRVFRALFANFLSCSISWS